MRDKLQIVQPEYEILESADLDSLHIGRIVPIYSTVGGLGQKYVRTLADLAISKYCRALIEKLPTYLIAREKLVDIKFAMHNIHFPANFVNLEKAYKRIVFEEFFMLQLALAIRKKRAKDDEKGLAHKIS